MKNQDTLQITSREVYNDIKEALSGIGDALQVGSEHVYEVLVKQQFVTSVSLLLINVVVISISSFLIKGLLKLELKENKGSMKDNVGHWMGITTLFVFIAFLFVFSVGDIITGFVNPEYGAMMEIKSFLK